MSPPTLRLWKLLILCGFILGLILEVVFVIRQEKRETLADRAEKAAAELMAFSDSRAQKMQREPKESFEEYAQRISKQNADAESVYTEKYYPQIAELRTDLDNRGFRNTEVDAFYQKPGQVIAMREIGKRLFEMADALRSESFL